MRSSISNFNLLPLAKALAAGIAFIALLWALLPSHFDFDEFPVLGIESFNELVLEQYTYEYAEKPIVFVGSSIQQSIPPPSCRPEDVATIYLQGRSGLTGLDAIVRLAAAPKVVFVETTTLAITVDQELIDIVFRPVYWKIRALIPPLRQNRSWLVLLNRKIIYDNPSYRTPSILELPSQSVANWDKEIVFPRWTGFFADRGNAAQINAAVSQLVARVKILESRGTKVIFYNPMDPRLAARPAQTDLLNAIRAALPHLDYIPAPDDRFPIYRHDGMHVVAASGAQLFDFLMEQASLPQRSLCPVRKAVGR